MARSLKLFTTTALEIGEGQQFDMEFENRNGRDEQVSSLLTVQTGDKLIEPDPPVDPDPPAEGIIQFKDPAVKALCVANWDRNGDGELSVAEAADVMDLGRVFESSDIVSFNTSNITSPAVRL